MFCCKCGSYVKDDAVFCGKCGNPVMRQPVQPSGQIPQAVVGGEAAGASKAGKSSVPKALKIGLPVGLGVVAIALVMVLIFVVNGSSGGSGETVPVAEQPVSGSASAGDAVQNSSGGDAEDQAAGSPTLMPSPAPTAEPTPSPTPKPTPEPTPEPVLTSNYLNDKEFDNLNDILKYCKKLVEDGEIDSDILSAYKMSVRAASGMTEAYFISFNWSPSVGMLFIKEDGSYHAYLRTSGYISLMSEDGEAIITNQSYLTGDYNLNIYLYSESDRSYENIDSKEFRDEGNAYDKTIKKLCDSVGMDKSEMKEADMEFVKEVSVWE